MTTSSVVIPPQAQKKYPDLVEMVLESESMNDQERNYWLQVLPVMKDDQVQELRKILEDERKKRAEIKQKYEPKPEPTEVDIKAWEEKKRQDRIRRQQAEAQARKQEDPDALLAQLENL